MKKTIYILAAGSALPVFLITSVFSAAVDLMFVMIRRYNRPRIIKLIR